MGKCVVVSLGGGGRVGAHDKRRAGSEPRARRRYVDVGEVAQAELAVRVRADDEDAVARGGAEGRRRAAGRDARDGAERARGPRAGRRRPRRAVGRVHVVAEAERALEPQANARPVASTKRLCA